MRKIKFRIWNKIDKKMIVHNTVDTKRFLSDMNGNIGFMDLDTMKWSGLIPEQYVEIMRYTGLKDENDKEIYEGDIISFYNDEEYKLEPTNALVIYESGAFMLEHKKLGKEYLGEMDIENMCIKVIDNIYENSELLDK